MGVLLGVARDLTASLATADRYSRLLDAVRRVIPCDAACLFRVDGPYLTPVAGFGLSSAALSRRYDRREQPRLDVILRSKEPVRFPPDAPIADPFDGEIVGAMHAHDRVHACLGCALTVGDEVVGALAADALEPNRFDALDTQVIGILGALAGAALRTAALVDGLERRADHRGQVARELQRSLAQGGGPLLGSGPAMARLREELALVARSDLAVLITGETGSGKELVARQIHEASARADEAMIHVNCAALPVSIAESELFGHVAGAFTGAVKDRAGKFEVADGGTLFLDEVGELPLELQPKLLRALQQGEIQRVGSDRVHRVDVRVIAATNRNFEREVEQGRFRADLYHRLTVFPLRVPPLRERREDIPLLASHFADAAARRIGVAGVRLDASAKGRLVESDWPGNVRELENVVARAVLRAAAARGASAGAPDVVIITASHLDVASPAPAAAAAPATEESVPQGDARSFREQVAAFERRLIATALERHGGNWAAAARSLGMHRSNLHHLATRLGLRG
ncbi:MAG TPA: nitric oxide reductase transcriptional regulator NorR [Vicinamibacterales bacterium]